ncbi:MAG: hypothetical protein GY702_03675, partial [Desulfobulbaceae bacterium]|nr:hypothetical protein [Desulfobulbaceae bacterium]
DDWLVEALGGQGQLIRVWYANRNLPWQEVSFLHSFLLLKTVHDTSIQAIYSVDAWEAMDVGLRNFWEMAGVLARSNNRREFDTAMEGIRGEMLSTFDFHNESWGQHHETLIRGLEKKARVLFPDPAGPPQRNLNRESRGIDNGSVAGSEPEGVIPGQEVAPLYASTPGVPCFDIAPGNEYGGATEKSNHSVRSNE